MKYASLYLCIGGGKTTFRSSTYTTFLGISEIPRHVTAGCPLVRVSNIAWMPESATGIGLGYARAILGLGTSWDGASISGHCIPRSMLYTLSPSVGTSRDT